MDEKSFKILCGGIDELSKYFENKNTIGACFKTAFEVCVLLAEKNIYGTLVHANITIEDKILGHAWVEYENIVIDFTLSQGESIQDKNEYYEFAQIHKIVKYTGSEIQELIKTYGNKVVWADWLIYQE